LDDAVLDALLSAYERTDAFNRALADSAGNVTAIRAKYEGELKVVAAELVETEERIKRYLLAFESGNLPEAACGDRIRELNSRTAELTNRRATLIAELEGEPMAAPTDSQLDELRHQVRAAVEQGSSSLQKALVQALVKEVRVEGKGLVVPYFRLPNPNQSADLVRAPAGVVGRPGLEPGTLGLRVRPRGSGSVHFVRLRPFFRPKCA
jgi:site-specific DNA recombinase